MRQLGSLIVAGAAGAAMTLAGGGAVAQCATDSLDGCVGKPWVDGEMMETPARLEMVAEPDVGRGRPGGVDQLVQEPRSGHARRGVDQGRQDHETRP